MINNQKKPKLTVEQIIEELRTGQDPSGLIYISGNDQLTIRSFEDNSFHDAGTLDDLILALENARTTHSLDDESFLELEEKLSIITLDLRPLISEKPPVDKKSIHSRRWKSRFGKGTRSQKGKGPKKEENLWPENA